MSRSKDQTKSQTNNDQKSHCCCWQLNNLPSIWYGIVVIALQVYIAYHGGFKFVDYLRSHMSAGISSWETNLYVALQGSAVLLLFPLALASFFKLGNLANDGFRLGRRLDLELDLDLPRVRSKSRDPLITSGSACGAAWRHCPPVAPMLHAIAALASLTAKTILEARLTKDGIINRDHIWNTDLDFAFLPSMYWTEKSSSWAHLVQNAPFPCPEFLSYVLALLTFAVRSSDVYWGANKCLAFLISLQLSANGIHALLAFCGAAILYKVQLLGVPASLLAASGSVSDYLILDPPITIMLLLLLSITLLLACSPLTMYALNKLSSFLMKSRRRYMQELPAAKSYLWSFYPHLAALATLLAVAACAAPILHDLSRLYKLNPQPILLASVTCSIVHAFLWVALWLLLTAKSQWDFRLKICVGRTLLKSPSSLALAAQVEYQGKTKSQPQSEEAEKLLSGTTAPILILANGKAYNVQDSAIQKKIQELVCQQSNNSKENENHQVYWLRGGANLPSPSNSASLSSPSLPEPISSSSSSSSTSSGTGVNLTTSPTPSASVTVATTLSPIVTRPVRRPLMKIPNSEDDGDYATLRDLPLVTLPEEPANTNDTQETSSSSDSSGVDSGFGSGSQSKRHVTIATPVNCPRVTRDLCNPYGYIKPKLTTFAQPGHSNTIAMHPIHSNIPVQHSPFHSLPMGHRPLSSHMNGVPHSVLIHRPVEERRPVIQACLLAGQGLDSNTRN